MRWLTFNKVYAAMVIMAAVSALAAPKALSDSARAQVQSLFSPVSRTVRAAGGYVYGRFQPPRPDPEAVSGASRTYQQIADENQALRVQLAHLTEQLRRLEQINADRQALGTLRELCRPMRVTGADAGTRRSLSLSGSIEGLRRDMPVLYGGGLVGKLDRVGWSSGAAVQLISDGGFRVTARFARLSTDGRAVLQQLGETTTLLEGDTQQGMVARTLTTEAVKAIGLQPGDWAVIADDSYPQLLQGYRIGTVESIKAARSPGFGLVAIKPTQNLLTLTEVMVLAQ